MKQFALNFVLVGMLFGSYAAWSALQSWPFDVALLGFAYYGLIGGLLGVAVAWLGLQFQPRLRGLLLASVLAGPVVFLLANLLVALIRDESMPETLNYLTGTVVPQSLAGMLVGVLAWISHLLTRKPSKKQSRSKSSGFDN